MYSGLHFQNCDPNTHIRKRNSCDGGEHFDELTNRVDTLPNFVGVFLESGQAPVWGMVDVQDELLFEEKLIFVDELLHEEWLIFVDELLHEEWLMSN